MVANIEKFACRIMKVHWFVATKLHPQWKYHEMLEMIVQRPPNHILKVLERVPEGYYYSELRTHAQYQLFLRKTIGEVCIEDRKEIDLYYRKTKARCRLSVRARRGVLVGARMAKKR